VEIYRAGLERKFALSKSSWGNLGFEFVWPGLSEFWRAGVGVCVDLIGPLVDVSFGWGGSLYIGTSPRTDFALMFIVRDR
jgi:hypothetical protein